MASGATIEYRVENDQYDVYPMSGRGVTTMTSAPVTAKVVRTTQTAAVADAPPSSIRLLRLYHAPAGATPEGRR